MASDLNLVQQASAKLQPLIALIGDKGDPRAAMGNVPMANDSALNQQQAPTMLRSLEALFHSSSPQSDQIVRSQAGGYKVPGGTQQGGQRDSGPTARAQEVQIGLGLFNPRTFMRGSRDQQSGGDEQGRGGPQFNQQAPVRQVSIVEQLLQAQAMLQNGGGQNNGLTHLLSPIRSDAVKYAPLSPKEVANNFNELMNELGFRIASELNNRGTTSSVPQANAGELMGNVPASVNNAAPMNSQQIVKMLEEAISLRLLQENQSMGQQDQSSGVMEAARLVLTTLVNKLQGGEIESSPTVMNSIVEALESIIALNPELKNTGVGQRLTAMRGIIAAMPKNPAQGSDAPNNDESVAEPSAPNLDSTGWKVADTDSPMSRGPIDLPHPKAYDTLASGSMDASGVMNGVGFGDNSHENFNYQLNPDQNGVVHIIGRQGVDDPGFRAIAKMNRDDTGKPVSVTDGCLLWNGGNEGVRMNSEGRGEVTSDAGRSWIPLPNGDISRYQSQDGRYEVAYNPVERSVSLLERNESGKNCGTATLKADGFGVAFSNLSSDRSSVVGQNLS